MRILRKKGLKLGRDHVLIQQGRLFQNMKNEACKIKLNMGNSLRLFVVLILGLTNPVIGLELDIPEKSYLILAEEKQHSSSNGEIDFIYTKLKTQFIPLQDRKKLASILSKSKSPIAEGQNPFIGILTTFILVNEQGKPLYVVSQVNWKSTIAFRPVVKYTDKGVFTGNPCFSIKDKEFSKMLYDRVLKFQPDTIHDWNQFYNKVGKGSLKELLFKED